MGKKLIEGKAVCLVLFPTNVEKGEVLIGFPKVNQGKGYGKEGDKRTFTKSKREKGVQPTEGRKGNQNM